VEMIVGVGNVCHDRFHLTGILSAERATVTAQPYHSACALSVFSFVLQDQFAVYC